MSLVQDGAAGGLVYAAGLHAYQTVLHQIHKTYAILAAQLVEIGYHLNAVHLLAVSSSGDALLKVDGHIGSLVGSLFGGNTQLQEALLVVLGLICGILQVKTLMGQMPQVLVLGVVGLSCYAQRDVVCLSVIYLLITGLDAPLSPGSDYSHIRSKCLYGKLKAHLIVALACAAVGNGISALLESDLCYLLCNDGTGKGGAKKVLALVYSPCLKGGIYIVLYEFFLEIQYIQLGSACLLSLFLKTVKLGALPNIGRNSDDFAVVVVFLEPGDYDGCIQSA